MAGFERGVRPVSYTHLDVYKRQTLDLLTLTVTEAAARAAGADALIAAVSAVSPTATALMIRVRLAAQASAGPWLWRRSIPATGYGLHGHKRPTASVGPNPFRKSRAQGAATAHEPPV